MKFCKNLQRVIELSDQDWTPYWTNYKLLKKTIKELSSPFVPDKNSVSSDDDATSGGKKIEQPSVSCYAEELKDGPKFISSSVQPKIGVTRTIDAREVMGKSPGEIKFFKLLHAELRKAIYFFGAVEKELSIREEYVQEGLEILKNTNTSMAATSTTDRWSTIAKNFYRLYKDLLLLETFAIMTYFSFSKILKKHDKVTGYRTRCAFMNNVVNKCNFAHYPRTLEMIQRTQMHCEEATDVLFSEGKSHLYGDERLFINMIQQLNEQVISSEHATTDKPNIDENLYDDPGIPNIGHRLSWQVTLDLSQQQAAEESVEETHGKKRNISADGLPNVNVSDVFTACESKKSRTND